MRKTELATVFHGYKHSSSATSNSVVRGFRNGDAHRPYRENEAGNEQPREPVELDGPRKVDAPHPATPQSQNTDTDSQNAHCGKLDASAVP